MNSGATLIAAALAGAFIAAHWGEPEHPLLIDPTPAALHVCGSQPTPPVTHHPWQAIDKARPDERTIA